MTFACAIEVATETENAAKVAKEIVFGLIPEQVQKVKGFSQARNKVSFIETNKGKCYSCEKGRHLALDCYFMNATCNYCKLQVYLESIFRKKTKRQ